MLGLIFHHLLPCVTNIVLYITGGIFGCAFLFLVILFLLKSFRKKAHKKGSLIEEAIDPKITLTTLRRMNSKAYREEEFRHSVIYQFYEFRIYCEEKLTIRNARRLPSKDLVRLIAGTPNILLRDVEALNSVYEKARNTSDIIDREICIKAKQLVRKIVGSDL